MPLSLVFLTLSSLSIIVEVGLNFLVGEFSFSLSTLKGLNALLFMLLLGEELSSVLNEVNTGTLSVLVGDKCIISETADVVESTTLSSSRYSGTGLYSTFLFSVDPLPGCDLLFFFTRNALGMISPFVGSLMYQLSLRKYFSSVYQEPPKNYENNNNKHDGFSDRYQSEDAVETSLVKVIHLLQSSAEIFLVLCAQGSRCLHGPLEAEMFSRSEKQMF